MIRPGPELDWGYVGRWIEEFARMPGRESLTEALESLRTELDGP